MISNLTLKHFKAIESANEISLSPITIICGKNSSGKSSIIQSLLLLKQTLDRPNINNSELSLEGDFLHFSHLSDISHNLPHANSAKIEYEFLFNNNETTKKRKKSFNSKLKFVFRQSASISKSKNGPYLSEITWSNEDKEEYSIKFSKDRLNINTKTIKQLISDTKINKTSKYSLKLYRFLPDRIIEHAEDGSIKATSQIDRDSLLIKLCVQLYNELEKITYSGPIRATPQRAYLQYSSQETKLEPDGKNIAQFLWQYKDLKISFDNQKITLMDGINRCLKLAGLEQEISVKRTNRMLYQLIVRLNTKSGHEVPITDVGFGYSQILPMIVNGLVAKRDSLTIYEQPEIHLHPSSAGSLADILLVFAKDNKRSIVETHSAELINKLRLRVIENPAISDLINIVFVERDETGCGKVRQFRFDQDGLPPDWPPGFLDESQKLAEMILRARMNR